MLFGHQNDDANSQAQPADIPPPPPQPVGDTVESTDETATTSSSSVNPLAVDPATGVSLPVAPHNDDEDDAADEPSVLDQPTSDSSAGSAPIVSPDIPAMFHSEPYREPSDAPASTRSAEDNSPSSAPTPASDDLLSLKQQALSDLSPLVGKLDQTPEEKFRTTMMLIQSTDDQSLLQSAYDAAQNIEDEKARAQALLDVVNEINYFTQQKTN